MIISKTKLSFICQYAKFEKDLINGLEMAAKTKQRNNWTQKHIKTQCPVIPPGPQKGVTLPLQRPSWTEQ